jgi:hypothetical protein
MKLSKQKGRNRKKEDGMMAAADFVPGPSFRLPGISGISRPFGPNSGNPLCMGKLRQGGKGGETPDIMRISLDQAERLMPSSSVVKVHCPFLRFHVVLDHF